MLSMPEQAATEHAREDARAEQARDGGWSGAAAHRDVGADHRRGRRRRRSLDLVLPRRGGPGGEEQQELGHGEDEDQQAEDRAERQASGRLGDRGEVVTITRLMTSRPTAAAIAAMIALRQVTGSRGRRRIPRAIPASWTPGQAPERAARAARPPSPRHPARGTRGSVRRPATGDRRQPVGQRHGQAEADQRGQVGAQPAQVGGRRRLVMAPLHGQGIAKLVITPAPRPVRTPCRSPPPWWPR